jgi:hypothetical protein
MPLGERERVGVCTSSSLALVEKYCDQTLTLIITVNTARDLILQHDVAYKSCHLQTPNQYQTNTKPDYHLDRYLE